MHRSLHQAFQAWLTKVGRKPLILRGARQVGKTWFVRQYSQSAGLNLLELNFEANPALKACFEDTLEPKEILEQLEVMLDRSIEPNTLLFLDEIQACPKAYVALKFFCDKQPDLPVVAAGSHLGILEQMDSVSHPIGYVEEMQLFPMSFEEFLIAVQPQKILLEALHQNKKLPKVIHDKLMTRYREYLFVGGLPETVELWRKDQPLKQRIDAVRQNQRQLLNLYKSDFSKYHGNSALHLVATWEAIARQLHQTHDASTNRFQFKGVLPGKKAYAQFQDHFQRLEATGLIYRCPVISEAQYPLKVSAKDSLFKAFYFDTGILLCELDYSYQALMQNENISYKGFLTENYVATELKNLHCQMFSYKTKSSEVEFLVQNQTSVIPIEVKNNNLKAKSFINLLAQHPSFHGIKVSCHPYFSEKRFDNYPLYQVALAAKNSGCDQSDTN